MKIDVLKLRLVDGNGAVCGYADVTIAGEITLYGCKIVQQDGQRAYVRPPDRPYPGPDGTKRWTPIVEIHDEAMRAAIQAAVLAAYEARRKTHARVLEVGS